MLKTLTRSATDDGDLPQAERFTVETRLALHHGGEANVAIQAEIAGPAGAPVLLAAGGISAGRHVVAKGNDATDGWWQCQAESFADHRLLAIDYLAADGTIDRPVDARDQARALLSVMDHLGIDHAAGFVGASYGAMVGMQLAAIAPHRVGGLLAISGAHRAHPFSSAQRALQRQAVELGERLGDPAAGVALARKLAILTYRSAAEFEGRFRDAPCVGSGRATVSAESYLDHQGDRHSRRMSAAAYRRLSESIDLHCIDATTIAVPATFVAVESDALVPLADIAAAATGAPLGRLVTIASRFGHDAFLKEDAAIAAILDTFLNSLEPSE
jgi:homoserine O-acetyltransferase